MKKNKGGKASRARRKEARTLSRLEEERYFSSVARRPVAEVLASISENHQKEIDSAAAQFGFEAPASFDENVAQYLPGQSDKCAICGENTPLNQCRANQSCSYHRIKNAGNYEDKHRRHRICNTCWFTGKNGAKAFDDEATNHINCPGCLKNQPMFLPLRDESIPQPYKVNSSGVVEVDLD